MPRISEIKCEVEKRAYRPKINETLARLGVSMSIIHEIISHHPNLESKSAVESKFAELYLQIRVLLNHQQNIKIATDMLDDEIRRIQPYVAQFERADSLPAFVIHFVHLLETANQYFDYKILAEKEYFKKDKEYLKKDDYPNYDEIKRTLLKDDAGLLLHFDCIKESNVYDVAKAIFRELVRKCYELPLPILPPPDQPALHNWIYRLVSRARQGDYVMDQDPEVELKKMIKNEPIVYDETHRYFLLERRQPEYNNISKVEAVEQNISEVEAYLIYSELVHSISTRSKEALQERQMSTFTTTARDGEEFDKKHKATSTDGEEFDKKHKATSTDDEEFDKKHNDAHF